MLIAASHAKAPRVPGCTFFAHSRPSAPGGLGPGHAWAKARWRRWAGLSAWCLIGASARRRQKLRARPALAAAAAAAATSAPGKAAVDADAWFREQLAACASRQKYDAALSERGQVLLEELDAPSRRHEPWRYTDLGALVYAAEPAPREASSAEELEGRVEALLEDDEEEGPARLRLVFVDGSLKASLSSLHSDAAEGGTFIGGREALRSDASLAERVTELLYPLPEVDIFPASSTSSLGCAKMAALNHSTFEDLACIRCTGTAQTEGSEGSVVAETQALRVEVVFVSTGRAPGSVPARVLLDVGQGRRVRLVESHLSLCPEEDESLSNGLCRVLVGEGAEVQHELLQQKGAKARFFESVTAQVENSGKYLLRLVQSGGRAARLNVVVALSGESSSCEVSGVLLAAGDEQLDLHSTIHHSVPGCQSKQQHKNVVADNAECIFKGIIRVDKEAQQTDSSQICRSLLLSKKAKVKAMPSLQIRADDVQCSHGAAVTDLDKSQVFYLTSRGLDPIDARKLMLVAFPQDLMGDIAKTSPKAYGRVLEKLQGLANSSSGSAEPDGGSFAD